MAATAVHVYRYDVTNNSAPTDSTTLKPAAVDGRISVLFNKVYRTVNSNAGAYMIATSTGKLFYIAATTDGDAFQ